MKRVVSIFLSALIVFAAFSADGATTSYQVGKGDITKGYIVKKIWLEQYAMPQISLNNITFVADVALPADAGTGAPSQYKAELGMQNNRPFLAIRIPAYTIADGRLSQVSGFTLDITEQPAAERSTARTTDVTTSALASGTWYKIGITQTGFYKIDYNFIKNTLGVDPSTINPADIRIFGNGGQMLSENNAVYRPTDLLENAIQVNSSGTTFGTGDNVIFYGLGTVTWAKDSADQRFVHTDNLYTDTAYYFITFDKGAGLRAGSQGTIPTGTVQNVTSYNYYDKHEEDLVNPAAIGKQWYGEEFSQEAGNTSQSFNFSLGNTPTTGNIYCSTQFAYYIDATSALSVSLNSNLVGQDILSTTSSVDGPQVIATVANTGTVACNTSTASITLNFTPADGSCLGYLYYIEINTRLPLAMTANQMNFRDWQSVGAGYVAAYQLQGAVSGIQVWDVTNPQVPVVMNGSLSGSTYTFTQESSMLHEFAAMNTNTVNTPTYSGMVANQNLHGSGQVDCIIVTNPEFQDQANSLATFHNQHDGLRTIVATTSQVYNEFSSGAQDISAIRDFARMFFKRSGGDSAQAPKFLILYGGGSYDYKNRVPNNSNFVPVYESAESQNNLSAYSGDDFFGMLEDNADINNGGIVNIMDVAVGRLPARNTDNANVLLNKILTYNAPATLGPWRIAATFVADQGCTIEVPPNYYPTDPAGNHMVDAETMAAQVAQTSKDLFNESKVYVDALQITKTPAGSRCPSANAELDDQIFKGTMIVDYNGHGNPQVWSAERILTEDDYNAWNNANMLPFMVTATCDFGQYDQPSFVSSAEQIVNRSGGGAIAIFTTTAGVFSGYSDQLSAPYFVSQLTRNGRGSWNALGTAFRNGKNTTYSTIPGEDELINFYKFNLLGDPALKPDLPQYFTRVDSITDGKTLVRTDSIKALGAYEIDGSVCDSSNNVLTDFNGLVYVTFFDKPRVVPVIDGCNENYSVQDNVIYKGRASVTNGHFSVSFITPKDINYAYGTGKLSTYAENGATDGAGVDTSVSVGGFSDNPVVSNTPPVVKAYMNDSLFLNGGITGNNSNLFVSIFDQTGINVSGNDVGHDMIAVLDGNTEVPYILNDYYESAPNTYQQGYVTFPITGLTVGHHTITVRAWDVNDNEGEGSVDFIVVDSSLVDIRNLANYPNPFTNTTNFVFEHNHPDEQLNITIQIFATNGKLARTINQTFTPTGSRTNEISWDGTDDNGSRLPSGVYVYRLSLETDQGFKSSAYQKLVIVR